MGGEPSDRVEEVAPAEIRGEQGDVIVTAAETRWEGTDVGGDSPGVAEGWGNRELGSSEGGDGGPKRSGVGSFGESVRDHVVGEG